MDIRLALPLGFLALGALSWILQPAPVMEDAGVTHHTQAASASVTP